MLFTAIDIDKKGYFTINEFKNFLDESSFIRQGKKVKDETHLGSQERIENARMAEIS